MTKYIMKFKSTDDFVEQTFNNYYNISRYIVSKLYTNLLLSIHRFDIFIIGDKKIAVDDNSFKLMLKKVKNYFLTNEYYEDLYTVEEIEKLLKNKRFISKN